MENSGKWRKSGWLLTTPRTGSTYLCYLLNKANNLPLDLPESDRSLWRDIFAEHAHPNISISKKDFNDISPFVTKLQWPHYEQLGFKNIPRRVIPIILKRRDIFAQTVSNYFSIKFQQHHATSDESFQQWLCKKNDFDHDLMLETYHNTNIFSFVWDRILNKNRLKYYIYYEDLLNNPIKEIQSIFSVLDTPFNPPEDWLDIPLHKMVRPETEEYIEKLKIALSLN